jgi:hypothetical protein
VRAYNNRVQIGKSVKRLSTAKPWRMLHGVTERKETYLRFIAENGSRTRRHEPVITLANKCL